MHNFKTRIDQSYQQIADITNGQARRDLLVMWHGAQKSFAKLDAESVECRRLHRTTARYTELEQQCEERLNNLEKHITFAGLLR